MKLQFFLSSALAVAVSSFTSLRADDAKDGKVTIYEVDLTEAGQPNREVSVTAHGWIVAEEETVPMKKVPEAPCKAIEAGAKGTKIERVNRIRRASGQITYEALYVSKGKGTEVEFLKDGKPKPVEK